MADNGPKIFLSAEGLVLSLGLAVTGESNTAVNVGSGAGVFRDKLGQVLNFRSVSSPFFTVDVNEATDEVELEAVGLIETSGPTAMLVGSVADGEILQRSGSTLIGAVASATLTPQQERVITETINVADTVLTDVLNVTPTSNSSVVLFFNGVQQIQGASEDYMVSGTSITWLRSTGTASKMKTTDDLVAYYWS